MDWALSMQSLGSRFGIPAVSAAPLSTTESPRIRLQIQMDE